MSRTAKIVWIVIGVLVVLFLAQRLISPADEDGSELAYSEFLQEVSEPSTVEAVEIDRERGELIVTPGPNAREPDEYEVEYLDDTGELLVERLEQAGIPFEVDSGYGGSVASFGLYLLFPALFAAFWYWLARRLDRLQPDED